MQSKITGNNTSPLFTDTILGKYSVTFRQCDDTSFIQTDKVFWLEEAYSSAITNLDLGLLERNIDLLKSIEAVLLKYFYDGEQFLDYGGGYGMFTRLMRDKGFNFLQYDAYCDNIFATAFSIENIGATGKKFDAITAFEVFEHLDNPMKEVELLLNHTDTIIFSTEIIPTDKIFTSASDWWYFSPTTGQHIAFYSIKSLEFIANKFSCRLYTNGKNLHIITKKKLNSNPFKYLRRLEKFEHIITFFKQVFITLNGSKYKKPTLRETDHQQALNAHQ